MSTAEKSNRDESGVPGLGRSSHQALVQNESSGSISCVRPDAHRSAGVPARFSVSELGFSREFSRISE